MPGPKSRLSDDPLWYKDAVIYEVHVKSFFDSSGDGVGDIKGLTEKLDYLAELGVTALWILPFYPSPLRDDGYDIADYYAVHPDYGSVKDFRVLLAEAHKRGIRVITELVINHTSDQHAWFRRARTSPPGSAHRDYYVWSDTPEKYQDARIIFKDFETSNWSWDPKAKAYFWHRFYAHQPDLNYDNPQVLREVLKVLDFWFAMGVDGLRLDAIPYLFEREGTNCENLPETYELLRKIRAHVDAKFEGRMLLAEANQWPEDAVAYFGAGDACHMAFHFPLMPRMFMAVQMEDRFPIVDILEQTPEIPDNCQWALFLRNHDELTLEMVTDEERDYMYRMYARDPRARINLGIRRRLAPLLENDRRKIELMNVLLFAMPGAVVLYYGDELGMGDNYYLGDRDGVRTPMQWSADRNAGFSRANPQRLYLPVIIDPEYHYEAINVDTQERNRSSLLWWTKELIALRKRHKALSRGAIEFVLPQNPKVLALVRRLDDEIILVVVNLSRYPQMASLDLSEFAGRAPEEIFGRSSFPPIRKTPYSFTLGPHGYYMFSLVPEDDSRLTAPLAPSACMDLGGGAFLDTAIKEYLESRVLPDYILRRGWLDEHTRRFKQVRVLEALPVGSPAAPTWLIIAQVLLGGNQTLNFNFVLSYAFGEHATTVLEQEPQNVLCTFENQGRRGVIFEGVPEGACNQRFLALALKRQQFTGRSGELSAEPSLAAKGLLREVQEGFRVTMSSTKRINTLLVFGQRYFVKVFRKADIGLNPDVEISRHLTESVEFPHTPTFLGSLNYTHTDGETLTVALLKEHVHAESDAGCMCEDAVARYLERVLAERRELSARSPLAAMPTHPVNAALTEPPAWFTEYFSDSTAELLALMGRRTAELHLALARETADPAFAPEEFSTLYQRSVSQAVRGDVSRVLVLLERAAPDLDAENRRKAADVLAAREEILGSVKRFHRRKIRCLKTRIHGDYHLGHLLYTGKDFVIIDFEGEPERPLSQRRLKRSPFRDIADMQRSLHAAAISALQRPSVRPEDAVWLAPWAELWHRVAFGVFLGAYLKHADKAPIIPDNTEDIEAMLHVFLLDKAFLELGRAVEGKEQNVATPLSAIRSLLERKA